jgi:hypothetical protein
MFPNDTVPVFNGFTFQTNLVDPIKHFPIHSILFHANKIIWFSNISILSVPDEGSRNASCALSLISTFVFLLFPLTNNNFQLNSLFLLELAITIYMNQ